VQNALTIAEARLIGAKYYFTGKPCPAGHVTMRVVCSRQCIQCAYERTKAWGKENADHVYEYNKQYTDDHRDHINARNRDWIERNPERRKATKAADYERHKPKRIASAKRWREANPEVCKEIARRNREANPERYAASSRNYKHRKRNAEGTHTGDDIKALFKLQKGKCAYCPHKLGKGYHVDHIMPLALGGRNDRANLQLTCQPCNQSKSAKHPIVFAQSRGFLL
jgi:5-methylcytosine-specific restriction endonuclease McrA